ncbi:hypothetical protein CL620_00335 [archaeon]|nr:hypothetical protein [archaeon]
MSVRRGKEEDVQQLVSLYTAFFEEHNHFNKSHDQIVMYLKEKMQEHDLYVSEKDGVLKGALFLILKSRGEHAHWKLRHFAFDSLEAAEELLVEVEKRVQEESATAKIELTIAENEEGMPFYEEHGYKREAVLANHYRWGEACYVYGKSFG